MTSHWRHPALAYAIGLVALTAMVFAPAREFEFVNYDDLEFVVDNPHVGTGLNIENARWAFANAYRATGGPLTWLSHMLDVELYGLDPGAHHITNIAIHGAASLAALWALWTLTGALGPSAFVAALFAIHPMHVESVAWISERKDVLSAFFWFASLWAYARFARERRGSHYALLIVSFVLGLMSKPMVATLPLILLLLDGWPLARFAGNHRTMSVGWPLIREKLPLVIVSAVSVGLVFAAQNQIGAVADFERVPLSVRLENAIVVAATYVGKLFWPTHLAVFYPYPATLSPALVIACALVLITLTAAALLMFRRVPAVTIGWFWYLITVLPVLGIVQVGGHQMADRFTYIPFVGLFIAAAWSLQTVLKAARITPAIATSLAIAVVMASAIDARAQTLHWRNGVTLWEHAASVTRDNARAHANLGVALAHDRQFPRAIVEYQNALAIEPADANTHNNLALALVERGEQTSALSHYREAVRLRPDYGNAHNNLANLLSEMGQQDEALTHHRAAIRLNPDDPLPVINLAITLAQMGRVEDAIKHLQAAVTLNPSDGRAKQLLSELASGQR
jgi:tetratricopeptide (TPR) repeat protein